MRVLARQTVRLEPRVGDEANYVPWLASLLRAGRRLIGPTALSCFQLPTFSRGTEERANHLRDRICYPFDPWPIQEGAAQTLGITLGFGLRAEVLEYPGGMPGDIGFILTW
jgi:hypothetical protein